LRRAFPVAVNRKRFFDPLWDFIFGMTTPWGRPMYPTV
jgi:hypothetical protein